MNIYTVMSGYEPITLATFEDYHELIKYIRRQKFNENEIYQTILNNWNEFNQIKDISESAYLNAHNGFDHYSDKNYER